MGRWIISLGKVPGRRPLQQVLRFAIADLQRAGQARDVFDDVGVEKRAAHFQRMRHRQPVDERQDLIRENPLELGLEHPVQRIACRQVFEGLSQMLARGDAVQRRSHVWRVEGGFLIVAHDQQPGPPLPVRLTARVRQRVRFSGHAMRAVAAEQLVGAVAGDRHLDVLRHPLRKEVRRDDACERLVERAQNLPEIRRIVRDRNLSS